MSQIAGSVMEQKTGAAPTEAELEDLLDEDFFTEVLGEDQAWAGLTVVLTAFNVKTKEGKDFTRIKYDEVILGD